MKNSNLFFAAILAGILAACGQQDSKGTSPDHRTASETIREAYLYGFPLVVMDITRRQMTDPSAGPGYAPPNHFRHNSAFPDASFRAVVRPNADTYYSIAWLDLAAEPIVLSVPDTKGRYYMLPMLDAFTNVFASPGTRTTGNGAGNFLITGPQWKGTVPVSMKQVPSPTNTVWIIGRTQVNSEDDGRKVVIPIQREYKLCPVSKFSKDLALPAPQHDPSVPKGEASTIVKGMTIEVFFDYVNRLLRDNPPAAADMPALDRFAEYGIGAGRKFDLHTVPAEERNTVSGIPASVFAQFDNENKKSELTNGWNKGRSVIGTYGTDYYNRASVAYFGLGANLREDAVYPTCFVDSAGNALNGANNYILHFEKGKTPPVHAFWSLTMYDPEGYFVDNKLGRYTLGDRSQLQANADSSVDIYIRQSSPGKAKEKNWLPAPPGEFNLTLRLYWPGAEVLRRNWDPPPVVKER